MNLDYFFNTVEPGRFNQYNFLCPTTLLEEAEVHLDWMFNGLLQEFGIEDYMEVLRAESTLV